MKSLNVIFVVLDIFLMRSFVNGDWEKTGYDLIKNNEKQREREEFRFFERLYYDCRQLIDSPNHEILHQNSLSLIVDLKAQIHHKYCATCKNFDDWPAFTKFQVTTSDCHHPSLYNTTESSFETTSKSIIVIDGGKSRGYLYNGYIIDGPCAGDLFSYYRKFPYEKITKCLLLRDDCSCKLNEIETTESWVWVRGSACGMNACSGYDRYLFPRGVE